MRVPPFYWEPAWAERHSDFVTPRGEEWGSEGTRNTSIVLGALQRGLEPAGGSIFTDGSRGLAGIGRERLPHLEGSVGQHIRGQVPEQPPVGELSPCAASRWLCDQEQAPSPHCVSSLLCKRHAVQRVTLGHKWFPRWRAFRTCRPTVSVRWISVCWPLHCWSSSGLVVPVLQKQCLSPGPFGPRAHLAVSGDNPVWGSAASCGQRPGMSEHPTSYRTRPHSRELSGPRCQRCAGRETLRGGSHSVGQGERR